VVWLYRMLIRVPCNLKFVRASFLQGRFWISTALRVGLICRHHGLRGDSRGRASC